MLLGSDEPEEVGGSFAELSPARSVGKSTVSHTVDADTATTARTGTMTIAGRTYSVTQAGAK